MVTRSVTVPVTEPSRRNCAASMPQRPTTAYAVSAAIASWPTWTVTASTMEYDGDCGIGKPSGRGRSAGPNPVPYSVSSSPAFAGASAVTAEPSSCITMAFAIVWPSTGTANSPGALRTTVKGARTCGAPAGLTVSTWSPVARSSGTCALICPGETKNSGSRRSPTATVNPPSVCGSIPSGATSVCVVRLTPKIDTMPPAATPACGVIPAAFITPAGAIYGTGSNSAFTDRGTLIVTTPDGIEPLRSPSHRRNLYPGCVARLNATFAFAG